MTIIELGTSTMAGIIGYIGDLFSDFLPLTILLVALFVGFWIIEAIINLPKKDR